MHFVRGRLLGAMQSLAEYGGSSSSDDEAGAAAVPVVAPRAAAAPPPVAAKRKRKLAKPLHLPSEIQAALEGRVIDSDSDDELLKDRVVDDLRVDVR